MTYYDILEVSENASDEVIRMAYKALAKKYHPDIFEGEPKEAEEKMKQINAAFEVLSNEQKRKQYDASLHNKTNCTQTESETNPRKATKHNKEKREFKYPSVAKSATIIGTLLFVIFCQPIGTYAETLELFDYALLLGIIDFCLLNVIMLTVPLFYGALKKSITPKETKSLCAINSIAIFLISIILNVLEITTAPLVGWIFSLCYYFVNKHILLQMQQREYNKTKFVCIASAILVFFASVFIGGNWYASKEIKQDYGYKYIFSSNMPEHKEGEDGKIYTYYEEFSLYLRENPYATNVYRDEKGNEYRKVYNATRNVWTLEMYEEERTLSLEEISKSQFLDENIVFVVGGFGNYYYTFDEMVHVTKEMGEYEYWAYNKEQAISLNYISSNINISYGSSYEKAEFLDENIVFVIDGFGNCYYTYDEMISATRQMDEYEYIAYNKEQAISLGYKHH